MGESLEWLQENWQKDDSVIGLLCGDERLVSMDLGKLNDFLGKNTASKFLILRSLMEIGIYKNS